ncbi:hypothetical protein LLG95_07615 [bacterium]|nr:hypothetical protein [bacterium]
MRRLVHKAQSWLRALIRAAGGGDDEFLCDTCQYDHGSVCRRPERPNATRCKDYRGK